MIIDDRLDHCDWLGRFIGCLVDYFVVADHHGCCRFEPVGSHLWQLAISDICCATVGQSKCRQVNAL